jgi:cytochrome c2
MITMASKTAGFASLIALFGLIPAQAADLDQMDGRQLYNKECSVCHGNLAQKTGQLSPVRRVLVAMADSDGLADLAGERLAVVPIYGPPLSGVIGRTAGTISGYAYSKSFLQKMDGVTWDEARLDTWIKSSQTMVPGSYMFYSQKKPEVRDKIVQYLKEQSQ